ncbi:hypothetical protein [Thioflavicoccus mobilis]|uniref:hypothetical protein n=1 Tax=Thioflavicoccus mobilis TaxID=80679 RepID=UPI0012FAE198|nr:hypothetical protein [Thioflavicoccus mobilis]
MVRPIAANGRAADAQAVRTPQSFVPVALEGPRSFPFGRRVFPGHCNDCKKRLFQLPVQIRRVDHSISVSLGDLEEIAIRAIFQDAKRKCDFRFALFSVAQATENGGASLPRTGILNFSRCPLAEEKMCLHST